MWVQLPDPLSSFHVFNFLWVCAVGGSGNETRGHVGTRLGSDYDYDSFPPPHKSLGSRLDTAPPLLFLSKLFDRYLL